MVAQKHKIAGIEKQMEDVDFWQDHERAGKLSQELAELKENHAKWEEIDTAAELLAMEVAEYQGDEDEAKTKKLAKEFSDLEKIIAGEEKKTFFAFPYAKNNAILSIYSGAGGTEAQDWAQMLERMYLRFCERRGFKTKILGESKGDEAGVKSAEIEVSGFRAYGNLKTEAGVHRLVRISPYDADKARHTSFALVEVIPNFEEAGDIDINEKDLKIDVYRASGHGGQSVNTTDSAVRITHLPTKTVVAVQNERSQLQNREVALKILKAKLKAQVLAEKLSKERDLKGAHVSAEWGNQIRSYVLAPYQQVKDHRTGFESSDPQKVLDGQIEEFILQFLKKVSG